MEINVIKETKFKDVIVTILLRGQLQEDTVIYKTLFSDLLANVCEPYNTKRKVSDKLNALYGAGFSTNCSTYGQSQVLEVSSKSIHSSYVQGQENLLEEQFKLLQAFLLQPLLDDEGDFLSKEVEEAKRMCQARILRANDEPSQYCMQKAMEVVGKDQPLGIQVFNKLDQLKALTAKEVSDAYRLMLASDEISVIVCGDVSKQEVETYATQYLSFENHASPIASSYLVKADKLAPFHYGYRDISQASVTMLYTTNVKNQDADFWSLRVANGILGQTPSSLLFREVREKHSLCYSIYSNILAYDGILGIYVGVDLNNVEKTTALIEEQMHHLTHGEFDDEVLETTKAMLKNSIVNFQDDKSALISLAYRNLILKDDATIESMLANVDKVKRQDVLDVMKKVHYASAFVLTKQGE